MTRAVHTFKRVAAILEEEMKYREENPHLFSAEEGQQSNSMENMNSGNFNFPTTEYPQVSQERRSSRESRASSNNHLNMTYQTPSVRNIESHGQGKRTMTNLCRRDKERSSRGLGGTEGGGRSTGGQEGRRGVVTTAPESSRNPRSRNGNVDDNFVTSKKSLHSPGNSSERTARDLWREQFDCPGEHFCLNRCANRQIGQYDSSPQHIDMHWCV